MRELTSQIEVILYVFRSCSKHDDVLNLARVPFSKPRIVISKSLLDSRLKTVLLLNIVYERRNSSSVVCPNNSISVSSLFAVCVEKGKESALLLHFSTYQKQNKCSKCENPPKRKLVINIYIYITPSSSFESNNTTQQLSCSQSMRQKSVTVDVSGCCVTTKACCCL